jgi:uncharacterized protein
MTLKQPLSPVRETKRAALSLNALEADGTFSGYASLFGAIDLGQDAVEPGAFAKSLKARGAAGIRMLFQHDPNEPIGRWTRIVEDRRGLLVQGQLSVTTRRGREVLALMRDGALDGLSIGFRTVRARKDAAGVRRIIEADLWEISVVTFPMLPGARVAQVKGRAQPLPTIRQFERWLTRDAGLTRSEARAVIARGFASLKDARDAIAHGAQDLAGKIREAARELKQTGMKRQ